MSGELTIGARFAAFFLGRAERVLVRFDEEEPREVSRRFCLAMWFGKQNGWR
jgi:hypothetical protein